MLVRGGSYLHRQSARCHLCVEQSVALCPACQQRALVLLVMGMSDLGVIHGLKSCHVTAWAWCRTA